MPLKKSKVSNAASGVNLVQSLGGTKQIFASRGWRETHCVQQYLMSKPIKQVSE